MMNSVFRSFGSGSFGSNFPNLPSGASGDAGFAPSIWSPRIDVQQRGDSLQVCADLPGVRKEDVNIELTEEGLTITGERREEREEGGRERGYRSIERSYGSFYRTIPLPKGLKTEELKAQMQDGVLEITIPLDERARPRRIQIQG
jgi:HSP20 family protein